MNTESSISGKNNEIDIIKFLRVLWIGRNRVMKIVSFFMIIGLFVAVFSVEEYTASTTFVPQSSKSNSGNLSGLAALAGVNLGSIREESSISPELYPRIINNISFQKEMLETLITIKGQDRKITYKEYYTNVYSPGVLSYIKKYTIGLPKLFINLFKSDKVANNIFDKNNYLMHISREDKDLIDLLNDQLLLSINNQEGYITLSGTMPQAKAVAELTKRAQDLLEQYVINFKIKKSKVQLDFIKKRYLEKEKEFKRVQQKLALYTDQNQNVNSARAKTKLMYLQSEYNLVYGVYSELAKQLEAQEIKVKKDTPIFTIIEPIFVPIDKTKPKRMLILVVWIFFGFILSIGFLLAKDPVQNVLNEIRSKSES